MHVEPKHIVTGAVMTVLLALFLFWQGDADGMDQQPVQMEQGASDGRSPDQAAKKQMAARYEKIRGMESQVAIEDLRNPFSPAHEKRGETVTAPVGKEKPSGSYSIAGTKRTVAATCPGAAGHRSIRCAVGWGGTCCARCTRRKGTEGCTGPARHRAGRRGAARHPVGRQDEPIACSRRALPRL